MSSSKLPYFLFLLVVAFFFAESAFVLFHFPVDDAWIHRVYSRSFAFGQGLAYNSGVQEAGETSPLWAIITSPAHLFTNTQTMVLIVKAFGILLALGILRLAQLIPQKDGLKGGGLLFLPTLLALEPRLAFSALSGMETLLVVLLWLLSFFYLKKEQYLLSAIFCGLAPTARPEAVLLLPLWFISVLILNPRKLQHVLVAFIPSLSWSVFCKFTNGHWLPNTFYAKAKGVNFSWEKLDTLWQIITEYGHTALPPFAVGILCLVLTRGKVLFRLWFLVAPLVYILGVATGRDLNASGYYWTRWLDPALIVLLFASLYACFKHSKYLKIFLILFSLQLPFVFLDLDQKRSRFASDAKVIYTYNELPGHWLAKHAKPNDTVGLQDAGAIKYFSNLKALDLWGLNDHKRLFQQRSTKEFVRESDWLVLYPFMLHGSPFANQFKLRKSFIVPTEEFTICDCPEITSKAIYSKLGAGLL